MINFERSSKQEYRNNRIAIPRSINPLLSKLHMMIYVLLLLYIARYIIFYRYSVHMYIVHMCAMNNSRELLRGLYNKTIKEVKPVS